MTDFSLKTGTFDRVNKILSSLDDVKILEPYDYEKRYFLIKSLYDEIYGELKRQKENLDGAEEYLSIMGREINKKGRGVKKTYFVKYADVLERVLREFIHNHLGTQNKRNF
jgi:hypothetical protein